MNRYILLFLSLLVALPLVAKEKLPLMPYPVSVTQHEGEFEFKDQVVLSIKGMSEERKSHAEQYLTGLFKKSGIQVLEQQSSKPEQSSPSIRIEANMGKKSSFQRPHIKQDESYQLKIDGSGVAIYAETDFGALQGVASLSQLMVLRKSEEGRLKLPLLTINDFPRFPWRGLMIDSVRHYISIDAIKRQLRGMASAKLNVFHWHLTDDQGWRFESKAYPKLHKEAADGQYYTQQEMKDVVAYASQLGIRVVPELDVPGHASAIAVAYPELISVEKTYHMEDKWGVFEPLLDPSNEKVYVFVDTLVGEFASIFPDEYLHIGGDEVNPHQWKESENVQQFMRENALANEHDLQVFFNQKLQKILAKHQKKMMGWDEIYHPDLPQNIMVQSWRGMESLSDIAANGYQGLLSTGFYIDQPQASSYHYRNDPLSQRSDKPVSLGNEDKLEAWQFTMPRLKGSAVKGKLVLIRRNDYVIHAYVKLNNNHYQKVSTDDKLTFGSQQINFGFDTWMGPTRGEFDLKDIQTLSGRILIGNTHYSVEGKKLDSFDYSEVSLLPSLAPEFEQNILGGEATLWAELVTEENIDLRVWPRVFVIAERLWSGKSLTDSNDMYQRLQSIDEYAANIGMHHRKQSIDGITGLVFPNTDITPLLALVEQLEPAQYYTRHHLKYQKGLYHQRAPLRQFVDFMPVESFKLVTMKQQLSAYKKGDEKGLQSIVDTMRQWHYSYDDAIKLIKKNPKLSTLSQVVEEARTINTIGLTIAQSCLAGVKITSKEAQRVKDTLRKLHSNVREVVLASGLFVEDVLETCR